MPIDLDLLQSRMPGRLIDWRPSIGSTMTEAARLAAAGCPHGTVVGADEQTAGIGRYGRHWHSEPDAGIYMSVVLLLPVGEREPNRDREPACDGEPNRDCEPNRGCEPNRDREPSRDRNRAT